MAPSGNSEDGQGMVHQTCDQPHSAASPTVPMATPASAPKAIGRRRAAKRSAMSSTSPASTMYSGKCGVV